MWYGNVSLENNDWLYTFTIFALLDFEDLVYFPTGVYMDIKLCYIYIFRSQRMHFEAQNVSSDLSRKSTSKSHST